jgi:hypothetical protein
MAGKQVITGFRRQQTYTQQTVFLLDPPRGGLMINRKEPVSRGLIEILSTTMRNIKTASVLTEIERPPPKYK